MKKTTTNKVRQVRESLGLSQQELADTLGVNKGYLGYVERGGVPSPSVWFALKVAALGGTTVERVFEVVKETIIAGGTNETL